MLTIPNTDHGKIRVFSVSGADANLFDDKFKGLVACFGNAPLNPDFVDIVKLDDLGEMSLINYIDEGYDVELDAADRAALSKTDNLVILIMSRAHEGAEVELVLGDGVRHLTTLGRGARMTVAASLESDAATGVMSGPEGGKPPKSDARIGGMVATVALLIMFALVAVMVWVGG